MKTSLRRILVFLSSHSQFLALLWLAWAMVVLLAYYAKTWFPGKVGSTGWEPYAFKIVIKEFFVVLIGAGSVLLVIESLGIHGVNRTRRLLTGQRRILFCSIVTAVFGLVVLAGAYYAKSWQLPGAGFALEAWGQPLTRDSLASSFNFRSWFSLTLRLTDIEKTRYQGRWSSKCTWS